MKRILKIWVLVMVCLYPLVSNANSKSHEKNTQKILCPLQNIFQSTSISSDKFYVEMSEISGVQMNSYNCILWKTTTEVLCFQFIVERSKDRITYEVVDIAIAAGNTLKPILYQIYDSSPYQTTHYRIKTVSANKYFKYSDVITIENNSWKDIVSIEFNSSENRLQIVVLKAQNDTVIIEILDKHGFIYYYTETTKSHVDLMVNFLKSGTYVLKILTPDFILLKQETLFIY